MAAAPWRAAGTARPRRRTERAEARPWTCRIATAPGCTSTSRRPRRFHLLALKGAGYLSLRLGRFEQGKAMLAKVVELDADDRLGARLLLGVLAEHDAEILPFPTAATAERRS